MVERSAGSAIARQAIEEAIAIFAHHGIEFKAPWDGDTDDRERERFLALRIVCENCIRCGEHAALLELASRSSTETDR